MCNLAFVAQNVTTHEAVYSRRWIAIGMGNVLIIIDPSKSRPVLNGLGAHKQNFDK